MIFLLFFLVLLATQTYLLFIVRTYSYQQTISTLYLNARKQENLAFAAFLHIATLLLQHTATINKDIPPIQFQPIAFSQNQILHMVGEIKHKNNTMYVILIKITSPHEKDVIFEGTITLTPPSYTVERFERIY